MKYLVGGAVRDILLNKEPHDKDYVVTGSFIQEMLHLGYKQVGNDFPVFLHPETGEEYALARKEVKTGDKHTDFEFEFGPDVTLKEDLLRRDTTMNALAMNLDTGEIIDYFGGKQDIENKIIRHVSEHFIEDPLRVLRVARQACEHDMDIAPETMELCKQMVADGMLQHLTEERVWKEVEKALHTVCFDKFLTILDEMNALQVIFPEVFDLKFVLENLVYHPEGKTYNHILLTLKHVFYAYFNYQDDNVVNDRTWHEISLMNFAMVCHDLGKAITDKDKWPKHHEHETLGLSIINKLCNRLKVPNEYRNFAIMVCKNHMKFYEYTKSHVKTHYDLIDSITKFKSNNYWKLNLLLKCHECDLMGRAGQIAQDRIDRYQDTKMLINKEFNILKNKTLTDLPPETQENLSRFKGEQFGKLYRDARISYLKHGLHE